MNDKSISHFVFFSSFYLLFWYNFFLGKFHIHKKIRLTPNQKALKTNFFLVNKKSYVHL